MLENRETCDARAHYLAIAVASVVVFVVTRLYIAFTDQLKRLSTAYADADATPAAWRVASRSWRSFVVGAVVARARGLIGVTDLAGAVQLALALGSAFPVGLLADRSSGEGAPMLAAIHSGDWLLKLLAIAVIVTLWR